MQAGGEREPLQSVRIVYPGGARPPLQTMIRFIEDHRGVTGSGQPAAPCRLPPQLSMTIWPSALTRHARQIASVVTRN